MHQGFHEKLLWTLFGPKGRHPEIMNDLKEFNTVKEALQPYGKIKNYLFHQDECGSKRVTVYKRNLK